MKMLADPGELGLFEMVVGPLIRKAVFGLGMIAVKYGLYDQAYADSLAERVVPILVGLAFMAGVWAWGQVNKRFLSQAIVEAKAMPPNTSIAQIKRQAAIAIKHA